MIRFLFKGLLRDRHRSLFPFLVVFWGSMLTVVASCWIKGVLRDMIDFSAAFSTGHVKIVTRAYAENLDQMPLDLGLENVTELTGRIQAAYPEIQWIPRIRFGGLLDAPDSTGETRAQGPSMGFGLDLTPEAGEVDRLNIFKSLVRGKIPEEPGEILISDLFAKRLGVEPGDRVTFIGSTMYGSMAMHNFIVSGMVRFGINAMDRGAMICSIQDLFTVLDMEDASTEILGFFGGPYEDLEARDLTAEFNSEQDEGDEFAPKMLALSEQNDLGELLEYMSSFSGLIIGFFVLVMSIVLWNAGLLGGLRRYGEVGVRLAIGEKKGHIYRSMIAESFLVGLLGSLTGTAAGLGLAWLLQTRGIDIGSMMKNATMMLPQVFRAYITDEAYTIGFIPGLLSTVLGTTLSGIGIYKRQTARLFKELEA